MAVTFEFDMYILLYKYYISEHNNSGLLAELLLKGTVDLTS